MIGKKFNRLKVIAKANDYISKNITYDRWICKCDCGKKIIVRGSVLRNSKTKSCGCLRIEVLKERRKNAK